MANWVSNYLKVSGKPERIKEFKEKANLDGRVFNFEAFVPFDYDDPDYQDLSEKHYCEPIEGHEQFNYKDWMIDHWGTDRNSIEPSITEETDDSIGYSFTTAWQPPSEFLAALEKLYPDLEFFHDYTREINDEGAEYLLDEADDEILSNMLEFANIINMDDENIEKFKKLYGEGRLSFSQIIPEDQKNETDEEWFDNSQQAASIFRADRQGPCEMAIGQLGNAQRFAV